MNGLERWHHVMKEGDMEALYDLLHPDCVFISPVVHTPQEGREITYAYLRAANKALSEDFQYVREVVQSNCLLYTSPSPRDLSTSRMPSSA